MKFYAYKPDSNGNEPMGTSGRILFELKTVRGAIRRARRMLGNNIKVFHYTNFYNGKTFKQIGEQKDATKFDRTIGGKAFPGDYNWTCPVCENECRAFELTCYSCEIEEYNNEQK